jgi:hypothetical protein
MSTKTFSIADLTGILVDMTVKDTIALHLKAGKVIEKSPLDLNWLDKKVVSVRGKTTSFAIFSEVVKSLYNSQIGGGSGGVSSKVETLVKLVPSLLSIGVKKADKSVVKLGEILFVQVFDGTSGEGASLKHEKKIYLAQDFFSRLLAPISVIIEAENRRKDFRDGYIFTARPKIAESAIPATEEEIFDL